MIVRTARFLDDLRDCFRGARETDIAVAFLTTSGLVATGLISDIGRALNKGLKLRVLVDLSAGITDPKALRALLLLQERAAGDVQMRAYLCEQAALLHTKLYIFKGSGGCSVLTGSANWTEPALAQTGGLGNKEHGLFVRGKDDNVIIHDARVLFRTMWEDLDKAVDIDASLIDKYEAVWRARRDSDRHLRPAFQRFSKAARRRNRTASGIVVGEGSKEKLRAVLAQFRAMPDAKQATEQIDAALDSRKQFLKDFPYCDPSTEVARRKIADMNEKDVREFLRWMNPNGLLWPLGRAGMSVAFRSPLHTRTNLAKFKTCLQEAVADPKKTLSERLDLPPWRDLSGFRADQELAKKIISVYFLDIALPIFNTGRLECYSQQLGIDRETCSKRQFAKPYAELSTGQKWEVLTGAILSCRGYSGSTDARIRRKENSYLMKAIATVFEQCNG